LTGKKGFTLIELLIVMVILAILAGAVFPMGRMTVRRAREIELRHGLRTVRTAIDRYKALYDQGQLEQKVDATGYPPTLELLVDGVPLLFPPGKKVRLLRRIPKDPMTPDGAFGLRSNADRPDSTTWGGEDVFDVYSKSSERAIDGSRYADW
jgi:general secretion pathway protein G